MNTINRKRLGWFLFGLFLLAAIANAAHLVKHYMEGIKSEEEFAELSSFITAYPAPLDPIDAVEDEAESRMAAYRALSEQNSDFVGWLYIEGTAINYPVMHTPTAPEYYMDKNFEGVYSDCGTPFLATDCDPARPSDNLIIYAHNMKSGTMFAGLLDYSRQSFWEEHRIVHFDTLQGYGEYEVIAAFKTRVYTEVTDHFQYYQYVDFASDADIAAFWACVNSRALYDTGHTVDFNDRYLTLSTCEYSQVDGRFVVVARYLSAVD